MLQTKDKKKVHPVDQLGYPTVSLQHIAMREGLLKFVKHLGEIKQAKKKKEIYLQHLISDVTGTNSLHGSLFKSPVCRD